MRKEDEEVITSMLGVKPVRINSSLITAQLRDRLYWTNIPGVTVPEDKGIKLNDILDSGFSPVEKARCLTACDSHGFYNGCNWKATSRFHRFYYKCFTTMVFPTEEDFKTVLAITEKPVTEDLAEQNTMMTVTQNRLRKHDTLLKVNVPGFRQFLKTTLKLFLKKRVPTCSVTDGL